MREPVVFSKGSREIAYKKQGSLDAFPTELAIQCMSDDTVGTFQGSQEAPSSHQTSKTQSAGFWSNAVEVVTKGKFTIGRGLSCVGSTRHPFRCGFMYLDMSLCLGSVLAPL